MLRKECKNYITLLAVIVVWMLLSLYSWGKSASEISDSERRKLTQQPLLSYQTLISGQFMEGYETYAQDQFPFRDLFRAIKATAQIHVLEKKDNNNIFIEDGYLTKLEYPLSESSIKNATDKFKTLYEQYMKEKNLNIYLSVIPDKGYFLAKKNGYPSMDYEQLFQRMKDNTEFAKYIDITAALEISDYYKTDIHWRQEAILQVADKIGTEMGISQHLSDNYAKVEAEKPFFGVYYGQAALPVAHEKLYYLVNDTIHNCTVYNYETNETTSVYDIPKLNGKDAYDVFLSGAAALLVIDNPNVNTDKEIIIFRDSFGSSLAPLLLEGYRKITLVDIRYIQSDLLDNYITFEKQDVLFLYSTSILNASAMLK